MAWEGREELKKKGKGNIMRRKGKGKDEEMKRKDKEPLRSRKGRKGGEGEKDTRLGLVAL